MEQLSESVTDQVITRCGLQKEKQSSSEKLYLKRKKQAKNKKAEKKGPYMHTLHITIRMCRRKTLEKVSSVDLPSPLSNVAVAQV